MIQQKWSEITSKWKDNKLVFLGKNINPLDVLKVNFVVPKNLLIHSALVGVENPTPAYFCWMSTNIMEKQISPNLLCIQAGLITIAYLSGVCGWVVYTIPNNNMIWF